MIARILLAVLAVLLGGAPAWASYQCFTKPNAAAASFPAQARLFEQDFQALALGIRGTGVIYAAGACQVAAQGSPNNTVSVTNGCTIAVEGATASVTSGNVTIAAANATNPRFTLVGATSAGVKSAIDGTPAASPLPPAIPDNYVPFAWVYVPANDNVVNTNQITDARPCIPTPGGVSGAPTTAKYWTEGSEAGLSAERNMSLLATGLIQNNTGTGIPTTLAPTDDNTVVGNGTTWQLKALPTCSGATNALTYNISTNAFGCNTISGGGSTPTGTGFTHITAGSQDAAAKLVAIADLSATGTPSNSNFLRGDNTWAAPAGGGNVTAGGTLTANAIIVGAGTSAVAALGSLGTTTTLLHGNAAGAPTFSQIAIADLSATGTPSSATFLRGDNTWNTPAGGGTVTTTASPASGQVAVMSGATSITSAAGLSWGATNGLVSTGSAEGGTHEVSDALTTAVVPALRLKHTTSGAMADGFGVCEQLVVRDNSAVDNIIGQFCATRSGADNTGRLGIATPIAGSLAERMVIDAAGAVTVTNLASAGTQCVQASAAGLLSGTGASCGGGSGPTITTFATSQPADVTGTVTINSLTTRTVHYFTLPGAITLNQLSIAADTVTTAGTLKLCIYSADGATKHVDITTGGAVAVTTLSTSVGSIVLPAGEYYAVEGCATTCNLNVRAVVSETGGAANTMFGNGSPAGKKKWHGTVSHTSGTCNATLGTITGTATLYPILRGDN